MFNDFFKGTDDILDLDLIHSQWQTLTVAYDVNQWQLPLPLWAQRGYEHNGEEAWQVLCEELKAGSSTPINIYIHIPFCTSKCGFCDSYSFRLPQHKREQVGEYVCRLDNEMQCWSSQGNLSHRNVTTVHMGGGTPTYLGEQELSRLVESCRRNYTIIEKTEWALESTVESLTASMLATLHQLGFRRIHIGVQSLEDNVRHLIGRHSYSGQVMKTIEACLRLGWIVSVDLLCGLPSQTLIGFVKGIRDLIHLGVDGFSVYELLIYSQNYKWAEKHNLVQRDHIANFWMFLAGAYLLEQSGFHKNLFNHWALPRDANIYFTFPTRKEDCLAIGTIADGVFGNYHYRHPRYASYMRLTKKVSPGLEGGLRHNLHEERLQSLTVAILSGTIPQSLIPDLQTTPKDGGFSLIERWIINGLIKGDLNNNYVLTPSGSWFAGNMITDLKLIGS